MIGQKNMHHRVKHRERCSGETRQVLRQLIDPHSRPEVCSGNTQVQLMAVDGCGDNANRCSHCKSKPEICASTERIKDRIA